MADPEEAHWSLAITSILRGALIPLAFLMPIGFAWTIAISLLTWVVTGRLRTRLASIERLEDQRRRDRFAASILTSFQRTDRSPNYFLYLRPFQITGQIRTHDPSALQKAERDLHPTEYRSGDGNDWTVFTPIRTAKFDIGDAPSTDEINLDFEAALEYSVRCYGPLVAFGRPGETLGAGRISARESDWPEAVRRLGSRARGFIIIPSANPGTRWELEWLKSERGFRDCLFLMPGDQPGFDGAAYWSQTMEMLSDIMRLPAFAQVPMMFCYDRNGTAHLAPTAGAVFVNDGRAAYSASRKMLRRAVRILQPLSSGTDDRNWEGLMDYARDAVARLSDGKETLVKLLNLANIDSTNIQSVTLCRHPTSVLWAEPLNDGKTLVEFSAGIPFDKLSFVVGLLIGRSKTCVVDLTVGTRTQNTGRVPFATRSMNSVETVRTPMFRFEWSIDPKNSSDQ